MHIHEKEALKKITKLLRKQFPGKIATVMAFGSRVRGDHGPWSDFDILIVVRDKTALLEREIIGSFVDRELELGVSFTPVIKDAAAFDLEKKHHTPFYENLTREGVLI